MEKIYKEVEELLEFIKEELDNMNVKAEVAFMNGDCGNLYKIFIFFFCFDRNRVRSASSLWVAS